MLIHQESIINADPQAVYEVLTDGQKFAAATGMPAQLSEREGETFTLFGGRVEGRQIELVPGQRIVQAWRFGATHPSEWDAGVYRVEYWNDPAAPKPNSLVPACGVLAADDADRVLLQRRRDTGQWAIPMGKQELGETPSQCAIRETLEETGVLTELTGILGVYSDPAHIVAYSDGEIRQEWELIFLGRPVSGTPTGNDEASDVRWVASGDLESLDIHPTQWRQLRDWLARAWPHVD